MRFQEAEAEQGEQSRHVYFTCCSCAQCAGDGCWVNEDKELFKTVNTPQKMLDLGEEGLIEYIKTIGLYRNKARTSWLARSC